MSNQLQQLQHNLIGWATQATELGWLGKGSMESLQRQSTATPGDLFHGNNRPLVVALFGGTGVGKSTLLNRLAGDDIARASAARPTSTSITVYVHSSITVDQLPAEFPMQRMHTAIHQNSRYRSVMWLDMPDFDSVEASHRGMVNQWLPHIDLLVYVVSPERYKDDQGWRLLLEHGTKHAWLFVINHWDKGDDSQRADFIQLLKQAGFEQPHVFCTDSSGDATSGTDAFAELENTIESVADEQLVSQLAKRGVVKRVEQLAGQASSMHSQLGSGEQMQLCLENWAQLWDTAGQTMAEASKWKSHLLAEQFSEPRASFSTFLPWRQSTDPGSPAKQHNVVITDEVFFSHAEGTVDNFVQQANAAGLPFSALQRHLTPLKAKWRDTLPATVDKALTQSLALPGERWQRLLNTLFGWLVTLLPLAAAAWISYRVVLIFQSSGANPDNYLGGNFATHSAMLMAVAWFLPWFLRQRTKPSRQAAALRGMQQGVQHCIELIKLDGQQAISDLADERDQLVSQLSSVVSGQGSFDDAALPASLRRMLMRSAELAPADAVRATAQSDTLAAPES